MKSKILAVLVLLSLLTSAIAISIEIRPAKAANEHVRVYIDPESTSKGPGGVDSFFDIFVTIEDVTDLFGFDIRVSWDNTLLTLDSTVKDTYLTALWGVGYQVSVEGSYGDGGGGGGGYKLVAVSTSNGFTKDPGVQVLFAMHFKIIKSCNFDLHTWFYFDLVKLSDSVWTPINHTTTNGEYTNAKTVPDLKFVPGVDTTPGKPFEICKTFQIEVYVSHICANLEDYNLVIQYDAELLKLTGVDWTGGVLGDSDTGGAGFAELPPGTITVVDTGGAVWSGELGLLFTLTFHIEFDDRESHIWHTNPQKEIYDQLHAFIKFTDATLSFLEGNIPMTGITMPSDLDIIVNLIRGDVDCDGQVRVSDLHDVAYWYDQSTPLKYDLNRDGTIDIFDLVIVATHYGYGP